MARVLVVDDEDNIRLVLETMLEQQGYRVALAANGEAALAQLDQFDPDFVLADVRMPGMTGLQLCAALKARGSRAVVIMMSAYGSVDLALDAMKAGAYDYIAKPFQQDEVLLVLRKAEERQLLRRENTALKQAVHREYSYGGMLGKSQAMTDVFRLIDKVAAHATTVLISGESGTGKELVARAIHDKSPRKDKPFVVVNCGAIPETLLESELFGHKRGAFTDARTDRDGLFAQANGGTLFLDEIGELPVQLQVKLLRVLQEGTFRPLGATRDAQVDVRIVVATLRDLSADVESGRFRQDLFYRLNVMQIKTPSLRQRPEDIPLLIEHFVVRSNGRLGTDVRGLDAATRKALMTYAFPGNVRELENIIERAVVLAEGELITLRELSEHVREEPDPVHTATTANGLSIKKASRAMEETLIRRALERSSGNRTIAAKMLEISHRALLYKIKDYGIEA